MDNEQKRFVCRSAEYNYITTKCHLSEHDRRSVEDSIELVDAQGVDYFENLCLKGERDKYIRQLDIIILTDYYSKFSYIFQPPTDVEESASTPCRPSASLTIASLITPASISTSTRNYW